MHSSRSLWDSNLPRVTGTEAASAGGYRKGYAQGPEDVRLRLVERNVDLGDEGRYLIAVAGDASEIDEEMLSFDRTIGAIFAALAVALLLTTALQVRFGLSPLKRISRASPPSVPAAPSGWRANFRWRSRRSRARPMR